MGLNKIKGNMYQDWVNFIWNPLAGKCYHNCSYCSSNKLRNRFPILNKKYSGKPRIQENEMKTNLGKDNFIFVCAQNDLFAKGVPVKVITDILNYCRKFDNKYLFQTKNPSAINENYLPDKSVICTTLETNRIYPEIMGNSPTPDIRADAMNTLSHYGIDTYITIEPIMKFDLKTFVYWIKACNPLGVWVGADSGCNNLPEPSKKKILQLITELERFTIVKQKDNLKRLL